MSERESLHQLDEARAQKLKMPRVDHFTEFIQSFYVRFWNLGRNHSVAEHTAKLQMWLQCCFHLCILDPPLPVLQCTSQTKLLTQQCQTSSLDKGCGAMTPLYVDARYEHTQLCARWQGRRFLLFVSYIISEANKQIWNKRCNFTS